MKVVKNGSSLDTFSIRTQPISGETESHLSSQLFQGHRTYTVNFLVATQTQSIRIFHMPGEGIASTNEHHERKTMFNSSQSSLFG